ncbi:MAG: hypothetical protein P8J27_02315 [Mariniblastus sp.]|nr:hypothetical protein [Mariniblastus sp.]
MNVAVIVSIWASSIWMGAAGFLGDSPAQNLTQQNAGNSVESAVMEDTQLKSDDLSGKLTEHAKDLSDTLNQDQTIQDVSAGILEPIYLLADYLSHPSFYWVGFSLMVAGVVSFAGQLLFAKFFLLLKLKLNVKEVLSDLLGLAISLVGLVLTTQAATQNSTFAQNSVSVVSATAVGVVAGLVFYWWGQSLELKAAREVQNNANA